MFCYIDDVLSLTNSRFWWFFYRIYSIGIEIKDISDTDRSVSHLDLHIKTESEGRLRTNLYDKRDHINFPIVILSFYLYVAAFRQRLHVEYISLSWSDIAELVVSSTRKLLSQGSYWLSWSHHFERFTVATMSWLTLRNICFTNDHEYVPLVVITISVLSSYIAFTWFLTTETQQVSLFTLEDHLSSPPFMLGFVFLDL
jgi:hypothetical protein